MFSSIYFTHHLWKDIKPKLAIVHKMLSTCKCISAVKVVTSKISKVFRSWYLTLYHFHHQITKSAKTKKSWWSVDWNSCVNWTFQALNVKSSCKILCNDVCRVPNSKEGRRMNKTTFPFSLLDTAAIFLAVFEWSALVLFITSPTCPNILHPFLQYDKVLQDNWKMFEFYELCLPNFHYFYKDYNALLKCELFHFVVTACQK